MLHRAERPSRGRCVHMLQVTAAYMDTDKIQKLRCVIYRTVWSLDLTQTCNATVLHGMNGHSLAKRDYFHSQALADQRITFQRHFPEQTWGIGLSQPPGNRASGRVPSPELLPGYPPHPSPRPLTDPSASGHASARMMDGRTEVEGWTDGRVGR